MDFATIQLLSARDALQIKAAAEAMNLNAALEPLVALGSATARQNI
jgi:hypothetical protein